MKSPHKKEESALLKKDKDYPVELIHNLSNLRADCANCFGLCCTALFFSASDGFPHDKKAGQPCHNLQRDFKCCIHKSLWRKGLKGCIAYDCFGAGQKVSQFTFAGKDWRKFPASAEKMFMVFVIMRQLHEMVWYLKEALTFEPERPICGLLKAKLKETERVSDLDPDSLLNFDVTVYREGVKDLLMQTSKLVRERFIISKNRKIKSKVKFTPGVDLIASDLRKADLRGKDLRGAYLIAADLRGADLSGTDLIGADFRDADLRGADLLKSIFLTQAQINSAKGDASTNLPPSLTTPAHWSKSSI